ncbi:MAG TPA: translocation/assembly module TamB domain-containing protein [Myxococcales bacterium]
MTPGERAQAKARKLLRRLAWSVAALATVVALGTWALLSWLSTPAGEHRLREQVLAAANGEIAGRLSIGGLEMLGAGGELVLTDVALFDPEGRLVARVERIEARADLLQLAEKRIHLSRVALQRGELLLVQDPAGLNLARAIAARNPGPPKQGGGAGFDWDLTIDAASASGLRAEYRPARGAAPTAEVEEVRLEGSGRYRRGGTSLALELQGALGAPLSGPIALVVAAHGGSSSSPHDPLTIDRLDLQAAHSRARLTGRYAAGALEASIGELRLARSDVHALAPDLPLASDLAATGRATLDARSATASLSLPALEIQASAQLSPLSAVATATLTGLDLAKTIEGAPPTNLAGTVSGRFAAGEPRPGSGELTLQLSRSLVRGVTLAQTTGTISLRGEQLLPNLVVAVPGGRASVTGSMALRELDLKALLTMGDLKSFTDSVARLAGGEAPTVEGAGSLTARVTGSARAPVVRLSGSLQRFESGAFSVEGLHLEARLPNARRPTAFEATVRADQGSVSELPFSRLDAQVRADGRRFSAELSTTGLAGVSARVSGELDKDQRGGRLQELTLATEDARWQLAGPAVVDLRGGVRVDRLNLRSGEQSLQASGGIARGALDVALEARQLDLAKLPRVLVRPDWRLAGLVSASGQLSGTTRQPQLSATLAAAGLGGFGLDSLDMTAQANLTADRIQGTANLKRLGATAALSADLPRLLLGAAPGAPASASVDLAGLQLRYLAERLGIPAPQRGTGRLSARLSGTAGQPRLEASVRLSDAMWGGVPAAGLVLDLVAEQQTTVKAELETAGGAAHLEGTAAISLRALASLPPLARLRAVPITAQLRAPAIVLGAFESTLLPAGTAGTASLQAALHGSAWRPRGEVSVTLENGALGTLKGLAGAARLAAGEEGLELTGDATLLSLPLAHLAARLGSPLEDLGTLAALSAAPVSATLELGPTGLESLLAVDGEAAHGTLLGRATLSQTLSAPVVEWGVRVENLRSGLQPLARIAASGTYRDRAANATATIEAAKGGTAQARGSLKVDLSLPSLARGVAWSQVPVEAGLEAKSLDLAVLEGLSRSLRSMAGTLSGEASLAGTLGTPSPRGTLALRGGAFQIPGYGTYRDVSLQLSVSDLRIDLPALTGRAGAGTVFLSLLGERATTSEPYRVSARVAVSDAPLVVEDQLVAHLTGETREVTGELSATRALFSLQVSRLVVDLPQASSKDLQGLDRNPDIVVVGGPILGRRQARDGAPQAPQANGGGYQLTFVAHAASDLWVQSSDAKIEAGADLRAVVDVGRGPAELTGSVRTLQGRVEVLGRRFELASGRLFWSAEPPGNPRLDVQAVHENPREQVKVLVHVTGTARSPRLEMSSEPPLDEQQIATLLATGRRELKRGSAGVASGGAASVLTSIAADRLRRALATRLPLDVLQVEVGDQGLKATQLEAGTYLTDQVYVGYRRNFGAETDRGQNANEVRVEYQLSPHVSIESQYGDAGRGGANVVYSRDY